MRQSLLARLTGRIDQRGAYHGAVLARILFFFQLFGTGDNQPGSDFHLPQKINLLARLAIGTFVLFFEHPQRVAEGRHRHIRLIEANIVH